MQSIKYLIFCLLICQSAFALPELKTKQALENLLYISDDGKVTYYQKNSGELQYSFNYKISTIMKGQKNTRYKVIAAKNVNHIAIERNSLYHNNKSHIKQNDIFIGKYLSTDDPKLIGKGTNPQFHLKGKMLSFYNKREKEIKIYSVTKEKVTQTIKLINKLQPYFIPQVSILTPDSILYNDVNDKGYEALLMYSIIDKKFTTIYKAQRPAMTLSYCVAGETGFILETPFDSVLSGSQILGINLYNNPDFKNTFQVYSSEFGDFPSIVCKNDSLYFIKTTNYISQLNLKHSEVAKINAKKLTILTKEKYLTQVYEFAGMILTNLNGKVLIVENNNKLKSDEIAKPEVRE